MKIEGEFESYIAKVRIVGGEKSKAILVPIYATAQIGDTIQVFYTIIKKGDEKENVKS